MEEIRCEGSVEEVERGLHHLARLKRCQISVREAALRIHGLLVEPLQKEQPGPARGAAVWRNSNRGSVSVPACDGHDNHRPLRLGLRRTTETQAGVVQRPLTFLRQGSL
jgi:hypothetical protein